MPPKVVRPNEPRHKSRARSVEWGGEGRGLPPSPMTLLCYKKNFVNCGASNCKYRFFLLQQYSSNLVQYKLSTFGGFLVAEVQAEIKRGKSLVGR